MPSPSARLNGAFVEIVLNGEVLARYPLDRLADRVLPNRASPADTLPDCHAADPTGRSPQRRPSRPSDEFTEIPIDEPRRAEQVDLMFH